MSLHLSLHGDAQMTGHCLLRTYLLLHLIAFAAPMATGETPHTSPESALSTLQSLQLQGEDAFVVQGELDPIIRHGGGGACASAAAVDALQVLRLMAGMEPVGNPHKVALTAIANQDELLNGRVSNDQLVRLVEGYAKEHLDGWNLTVEVSMTPNGAYSPLGRPWPSSKGPDLSVKHGQLKIVTYSVTTAGGVLLGRHFILLKSFSDNGIEAVDPSRPLGRTTFTMTQREVDGWGRRYFLTPPPKVKTTHVLELDAIFTLWIEKQAGPAKAPDDLSELKGRIDETAEELRSSGNLRSPRKWRSSAAAFGLPGLDLPAELGGSGWPASDVLDVFMHAGRHDLNCRDVIGGAHVRPLLKSTHPQVLDIVRQVARGNAYMAITMTEPHAGSDFHNIKSTARRVDGGYVLSGEKRYVARLEQATHVIVFTQPASGEPRGLSAFVLPIDTPGLEPYSFEAHGLKGNSFGGLKIKDVHVDDWQMIGADGEGEKIFVEHFRYWRLMQVAAALGTAERALELMVDRLIEREAYGGPIGRFTHLQQAVGQRTTELRMAKALAREAAAMLDEGKGEAADAIINGLKAEGVEIALATVDAAVRAFGAEGYSGRVDLGDRLQDLNGLRIADGTTDVMRMSVVAKSYGNKGKKLWDMAVRGER
jgi:alkylation response protein AidB-like acyl-CoA dehydrogenase